MNLFLVNIDYDVYIDIIMYSVLHKYMQNQAICVVMLCFCCLLVVVFFKKTTWMHKSCDLDFNLEL